MMKNSIYIFLTSCFSLLFSLSDSRLITTWDMPSQYTLYTDYLDNSTSLIDSEVDYDITSGLAFSYEHRILDKEKFNFFIGSEIMLGKKSDVTLAFHSIYLMPSYKLSESSDLLLRMGYSSLNSNNDFFPKSSYLLGLGSEIKMSDTWSVNFFNTLHQSNSIKNTIEVCPNPIQDCNEESIYSKIKYNKFSVSLVYKLIKKEENNSSRRRGRNS